MTRGQAERLMLLLQELLAEAGATWQDLHAIGVGIGPGNFTGIRIAVSAARGLALGLGVPAVGVTGFEARARIAPAGQTAVIPAPRDQVYLCQDGTPRLLPREAALQDVGPLWAEPSPRDLPVSIARIAAERWRDAPAAPAPLYVRPADAAPSKDQPPRLLDE